MAAEDAKGSLLSLARERTQSKRITRCTIGKLLLNNPDKSDEIRELIESSGEAGDVTHATAAEILSEAFDEKIGGQTVGRHQARRCACQ